MYFISLSSKFYCYNFTTLKEKSQYKNRKTKEAKILLPAVFLHISRIALLPFGSSPVIFLSFSRRSFKKIGAGFDILFANGSIKYSQKQKRGRLKQNENKRQKKRTDIGRGDSGKGGFSSAPVSSAALLGRK
jgi:hypothetical protein